LAEFFAACPEIDLRLVVCGHTLDPLEESINLAFWIGIPPDSSLIATGIGSTCHVARASLTYLAARGRPPRTDDVVQTSVIPPFSTLCGNPVR
jgi:DNA-binding transcriptional LysR family regulator